MSDLPARRILRGTASVVMAAGATLAVAAVLDFLRSSISGVVADLIPNLPLGPAALLGGSAAVVLGAIARRRLGGGTRLPSARPQAVSALPARNHPARPAGPGTPGDGSAPA